MTNKLTPLLDNIEKKTIDDYTERAEIFWTDTKDHDVSQNINALLEALPVNQTLDILDLGCGPGRDLLNFKKKGHNPVGVDGSERFCRMAKKHSRCPVWHQSFLDLDIGENCFDGIFANASLFHIPSSELPSVLTKCYNALKPDGILFTSNPRGHTEGWQGNRYCHYMEFEDSQQYLKQSGFRILEYYYRPTNMPKHQQPWLAIVSQRV